MWLTSSNQKLHTSELWTVIVITKAPLIEPRSWAVIWMAILEYSHPHRAALMLPDSANEKASAWSVQLWEGLWAGHNRRTLFMWLALVSEKTGAQGMNWWMKFIVILFWWEWFIACTDDYGSERAQKLLSSSVHARSPTHSVLVLPDVP